MEFLYRRQFLSPLLIFIIITFIHSIASRHHIRHHRDRFKRQQGANLYLPGSYVTSGGDGPDSGPWGEWSTFSQCSRTCGGGVSTQERVCYPGYQCEGPSKRHFSCNTQDCPDLADFRAQQCAEYDPIPFDGVYYQWVPYTKAPNPCQLNCMPRGELFYYRHKEQVTDGTPCNEDQYDVCVAGVCRPVGCDRMLGSREIEDQCRVCGGDGSMCNTVSDISNMQDLQIGYNDILLIPEGASNIIVQEVADSNNYLAVRNRHGHYYLNGNWTIDFPRTIDIAGCKFIYDRNPRGFMAPDSLRCLGPTNEPLIIVLLYQNTNVGIQYQYSIPKGISMEDHTETYAWTFSEFSPCSTTCGGGVQYREVTCAGRKTLEPADRSLCDSNNEPESSQTCAQKPCDAQWVTKPWGRCFAACGHVGYEYRQVYCEQTVAYGYTSIVDDQYCNHSEKPEEQRACNRGTICGSWHTGPWKPCDQLCGEGRETRKVTCYRKVNDRIEVLDDSECEPDEPKPESQRRCNLRPCEGIDWVTSEWSGCECGVTVETRRAECATQNGQIYPYELCENIPLPILGRECDMSNQKCNQQWYATQWSECSVKCGTGVQTRDVFCATINGEGIKKIEDSNCDPEKRYESEKNCTADREICLGEWFTGPWSACSLPCNEGERTRKVICMKDNIPASDPSECDSNSVPYQTEICNTEKCKEDEMKTTDSITYINGTFTTAQPDLSVDYEYEELYGETCENGEWVDENDSEKKYVEKDQDSLFVDESLFDNFDLMLGDDPLSYKDRMEFIPSSNNLKDGRKTTNDKTKSLVQSNMQKSAANTEQRHFVKESLLYDFDSMLGDDPSAYKDEDNEGSGEDYTSSESTSSSEYTDEDYSTEGSGETTDFTDSSTTRASTTKSTRLTTMEIIPDVGENQVGAEEIIDDEKSVTSSIVMITSSDVSITSDSTSTEFTYSTGTPVSASTTTETTQTLETESTVSSELTEITAMTDDTSDYGSSESSEFTSSEESSETEQTPASITSSLSSTDATTESQASSESEPTVSSTSPISPSTDSSSETATTKISSEDTTSNTETEITLSTISSTSSSTDSTETEITLSTLSSTSSSTDSSESESSGSTELTSVISSSDSTSETISSVSTSSSTDSSESESTGSTELTSVISSSDSTSETISSVSTSGSTDSSESESTGSTELTSVISSSGKTSETITSVSTSGSTDSSESESTGSTELTSVISSSDSTSETISSASTEGTSAITTESLFTTESELTSPSVSTSEESTQATSEITTESTPSTELTSSPMSSSSGSSSETVITSEVSTESTSEITNESTPSRETEISSSTISTSSSETMSTSEVSTESTSEITTQSTGSTETETTPTPIISSSDSSSETISTAGLTTESTSEVSTVTDISSSTVSSSLASSSETASTESTSEVTTETTESTDTDLTSSTLLPTSTSSSETISTSEVSTESTSESTTQSTSSTETEASSSTISSSSYSTDISSEALSTSGGSTESTIELTSISSTSGATTESLSSSPSSTESTESESTQSSISSSELSTTSTEISSTTILSSTESTESTAEISSISTEESTYETEGSSEKSSTIVSSSASDTSSAETSTGVTTDTIETSTETTSTQLTGSSTSESTSISSELTSGSSSEISTDTSEITEFSTSVFTTVTDIWSSVESTVITESTTYDAWGTTPITELFTTAKLRKCRKKVRKHCSKTKYGCCIDKITPAQGPFDKGCPPIRTCNETRFGCCEDGVSVALGKTFEGCPPPQCDETLFGCCRDNKTAAEGNDYEGCPLPPPKCIQSLYGCCEDNYTEAKGPSMEGCVETTTETSTEATSGSTATSEITVTTSESSSSTTAEYTTLTEMTSSQQASCKDSLYNCCPDGVSFARGIDFEGCDIFNDNCSESYFGCCPDGITSAKGPNYKACRMPCEESIFGCCEDGVTPSHGPYREGCCLTTQYGCCPDNIRPSQGPNLEGCGCQYSPYRCCPDNVTAALGYYNEGCGCQYTHYGCCPDNFTTATGINYEGCSCLTFQFGCCPDGISVAQGSQLQGCGCRYSIYGCCSDGQTSAHGPEHEGCGCETTQYGCCIDGASNALGSNFEGCADIPLNLQTSCALEKEKGPCRNYTVKWFYDMEYGGCSRFWYGGCDGNSNRFKTKEECNDVCIEPQGKDRCSLPKVSGGCDGYYPKWYYDSEQKTCAQFVYSGCLGNNNNFETRDECMDLCAESTDLDPCDQTVAEGPCRGAFVRWYYDKSSGTCNEFYYGGCKGNDNNFVSESACKYQCVRPDLKKDSCSLPITTGNCNSQEARWYYNQTEQRCMPFYYSGCEGNPNNFISQATCEADCPKEIVKGTCQLPAEIGDCGNYVQRWYYDTTYKQCRPFYYGGCGGNDNNFQTEQDCDQRCKIVITTPPTTVSPPVLATIGPFRPEFCFLDSDVGPCRNYDPRWYYDRNDGSCKQFMYGGCPGNGNNFYTDTECNDKCGSVQDLCTLPPIEGPCGSQYERWYYNPSIDDCEIFNYGGCLGNNNRFDDKLSCEQKCRKKRPTITSTIPPYVHTARSTTSSITELSICNVPVDAGNCSNSIPSYYYDSFAQKCLAFVYTGCGGNANRFTSEEQCERQCGRFKAQDVCHLRRDPGPCNGYLRKFYYDSVYGRCGQFVYGGCDGNGNRFSSQEECETVCVTREEQKPTLITNETKSVICRLPLDVGPCEGGYYKHYYFDDFRGECASFIYSGCGGNFNNFKTFQACLDFCKDYVVPTEPSIISHTEGTNERCQRYLEECGSVICEYGTEAFIEEESLCTKCKCHDPCVGIICREDQQCAVDLNRNRTVFEDPTFIPVCRDIHKEGDCPQIRSRGGRCERDCETDADCTLDLKCCPTSCGTICVAPILPVPAQLITSSPSPLPAYTKPHSEYYPPIVDQNKFQPEVSAGEGDYATLDCSVQGNPTPRISWRKGDLLIDGAQPRYRILLDGTLQIITLHKTDAGIYLCAAENGIGRPIEKEINLQVTDSEPHATAIVGDRENSHIVASLGAPATLHCYAIGFPFPAVTWWKDDRMVPLHTHQFEIHKDYSLLIHSVQLSNLGIYTCQAYNGIGKAASWSVTVQTLGPVYSTRPEDVKYMQYVINAPERPTPKPAPITTLTTAPSTLSTAYVTLPPTTPNVSVLIPTPTEEPPYVYQVPVRVKLTSTQTTYPTGRDISIGCDVEGYPIPQVQWYKNSRPINPSASIHISENHRLSIIKANKSDSGEYRCDAANSYSRSYSAITITVEESKVDASCTDNPFFANCELIVRAHYCIHKYYARFCCKSCTEAGQLPSYGSNLNDKEAALRSNLVRRK